MKACYYDYLDIVKYFVKKRCDLEKELANGATALRLGFFFLKFNNFKKGKKIN